MRRVGLAAGAQLSSSSRDSESNRTLTRSCRSFPGASNSGPSRVLLVGAQAGGGEHLAFHRWQRPGALGVQPESGIPYAAPAGSLPGTGRPGVLSMETSASSSPLRQEEAILPRAGPRAAQNCRAPSMEDLRVSGKDGGGRPACGTSPCGHHRNEQPTQWRPCQEEAPVAAAPWQYLLIV